jgi:hypothetical protein
LDGCDNRTAQKPGGRESHLCNKNSSFDSSEAFRDLSHGVPETRRESLAICRRGNRGFRISANPRECPVSFSSKRDGDFYSEGFGGSGAACSAVFSTPLTGNRNGSAGANTVRGVSRRHVLTDVLPGAVIAAAAIGWSSAPGVAEAAQTAQATTVRPHRHMRSRHRRWGCWWERGRHWWHWGHRVCGWR